MLDMRIGHFSGHDVEDFNTLWIRGVDNSHDITRQRNMSLVQEFYSQSLVFGLGDLLSLIGVDCEVLACID
jgi:hypothetical protein